VNGEWLFTEADKDMLRRQLWQVADYCGVQVITYCVLSNHFHILVRVPKQQPVSDRELLRRYRVLYPAPSPFQSANLKAIEADLERGGPEADNWRRRHVALMGDVSQYMKLLKHFGQSGSRVCWSSRIAGLCRTSQPTSISIVFAPAWPPIRKTIVFVAMPKPWQATTWLKGEFDPPLANRIGPTRRLRIECCFSGPEPDHAKVRQWHLPSWRKCWKKEGDFRSLRFFAVGSAISRTGQSWAAEFLSRPKSANTISDAAAAEAPSRGHFRQSPIGAI
jgi:hypothetical protein